jgi:pimeloyl-ACP methyl ester carboxylesterase
MLARLQQFATIGLALVAVAWAQYFVRADHPAWALAGGLFIVLGFTLVLALEFILLWCVNRADLVARASVGQLIAAWGGEVGAAIRVFCWQQPFRSRAVPDCLSDGLRRRGVVFVHGFVCNRGLWNPLMNKLRAANVPFIAVNLEPVFGSVDQYASIIDSAVQRMTDASGKIPVIVAHSMGGLAVRAWLNAFQADARVHHVITIGTPHHGTFLARFAFSPNARQMSLSSAWRQRLAASEPAQRFSRFTCFYGNCDNVVFPASTATMPCADNRHLPGVAHVRMTMHHEVFDELLHRLD